VTTRTPGKYGRRSPKNAPALELGRLLTGKVPAHPAAADYLAQMGGGWQMLGNDQAGDCAAVTWGNVRRLVTRFLGDAEHYPSQEQVWAIYKTQNPDFDPSGSADTNGPGSQADCGMELQTLFEHLTKHAGPDGVKAIAFAKVNPQDAEQVKAAIALFGYVWTGIAVLACNQQEFSDNEPWDYEADSPQEGGHSIVTGGYGDGGTGALGGDEKFITWAAETSFTDSFWSHCCDEAWVVIWPEHLGSKEFMEGVDIQQLAADYRTLTGRELPLPGGDTSGEPPAVSRERALLDELAEHVRIVAASADRDLAEVVAWLSGHGL
jgi:hypothetical protein